jgi:VanZ family protein
MVAGMLMVGLYPFDYLPFNEVLILKDGGGIRFYGRGEALSTGDTTWPLAGFSGQPITMELFLKPQRSYDESVPHILSLCDRSGREVFYLGQWKNHMVMRLLEGGRWFTRVTREIGTLDHLREGQPVSMTFVFGDGGVKVYADGALSEVHGGFDLTGAIAQRPIRSVVFGNSSSGEDPWQGDILGFSVFDRALDHESVRVRYHKRDSDPGVYSPGEIIRYRFKKQSGGAIRNSAGNVWDLQIPETLNPLRREFLSLPSADNLHQGWFYTDALVNLSGFIPLGFFLAFFLAPRRPSGRLWTMGLAVSAGFLLSLFIEANQVFLVMRNSSLTDLILNTLGTGMGTLVFLALSGTSTTGPSRNEYPGKSAP